MTIILDETKKDAKKLAILSEKSKFNPFVLIDNYLVKTEKGYKVIKSRNWSSGKIVSKDEITTCIN